MERGNEWSRKLIKLLEKYHWRGLAGRGRKQEGENIDVWYTLEIEGRRLDQMVSDTHVNKSRK